MTQIKIEVPADDTIALSALGEALTRIASERSAPAVVQPVGDDGKPLTPPIPDTAGDVEHYSDSLNKSWEDLSKANEQLDHVGPITDNTKDMIEDGTLPPPEVTEQVTQPVTEADETIDADGLPWDKRIHSRGKSRLADNTWRLVRKPADKSQGEWNEYVETVKAELKAVQSIAPPEADEGYSVSTTVELTEGTTVQDVAESITEMFTQEDRDDAAKEFDEAVLPPVEIVAPPVVETPPVETVAPPVVETPPVTAETDHGVTTFPELMKWITSVAKKRGADNDMIKAVLADIDPALAGLPLLATRADLIPTFVTKLEERLS